MQGISTEKRDEYQEEVWALCLGGAFSTFFMGGGTLVASLKNPKIEMTQISTKFTQISDQFSCFFKNTTYNNSY